MEGDPYRFQAPVLPAEAPWWAGRIGKAMLALSAVLWGGMLVGAYFREVWGVLGAELAAFPTGFAIGCLLLARRTRYAKSKAARVVAPIALGVLVGWVAFLCLMLFFGAAWSHL